MTTVLRLEVGLPSVPIILLIDVDQAHSLLSAQPRGEVGQWEMEPVGGGKRGLSRLLRRLQARHRSGRALSGATLARR